MAKKTKFALKFTQEDCFTQTFEPEILES